MKLNIWAILVGALIFFIAGALWYSPLLFGQVWADAHGYAMDSLAATPLHYLGAAAVALVTSFGLALLGRMGPILVAWLLLASTSFSGVIWSGVPITAYLIDIGFVLVSFLLIGGLLRVWRR